jgi:hypothetical protein
VAISIEVENIDSIAQTSESFLRTQRLVRGWVGLYLGLSVFWIGFSPFIVASACYVTALYVNTRPSGPVIAAAGTAANIAFLSIFMLLLRFFFYTLRKVSIGSVRSIRIIMVMAAILLIGGAVWSILNVEAANLAIQPATLVFLTNQTALPALTICDLYKSRWQVRP